jgi:hypothetical protein
MSYRPVALSIGLWKASGRGGTKLYLPNKVEKSLYRYLKECVLVLAQILVIFLVPDGFF